ncbi:hypothetical protein FOXB_05791 [Fusarium oxysporum f. sp. conglutinans Fo5176]|uniref:Uncharacterized protein n=1 Tax=Fusarium oxysporum (strain Fo5176) TaxID=660025 RepID=F9FHB2_FUSOF|nr:hypothetical protein FOXB_05791 [Fusarium oxysporum f. sp. conglutinans Fo5176]
MAARQLQPSDCAVIQTSHQNLTNASDLLEPLRKALARINLWIRHILYTKYHAITGSHVVFIKKAGVTIFALRALSTEEGRFQLEFAYLPKLFERKGNGHLSSARVHHDNNPACTSQV